MAIYIRKWLILCITFFCTSNCFFITTKSISMFLLWWLCILRCAIECYTPDAIGVTNVTTLSLTILLHLMDATKHFKWIVPNLCQSPRFCVVPFFDKEKHSFESPGIKLSMSIFLCSFLGGASDILLPMKWK